jgi:MFS family permease
VAKNIQTILIARFFDGLAGSAFLTVAGGTVGDLFNKERLQLPMMVYTASPIIGPSVGPFLGGFINQYTSWRWTFYMLLIWSGVNFALILFFVPETYHPVLLRHKARKLRDETGDKRWEAPIEKMKRSIPKTIMYSFLRPFQLLLFEPMCLLLCLFSAFLLGILYLFFGAFPLIFGVNHGFTLSETGMAFLGILAGMLLGISTEPLWRKNYERLLKRREAAAGEIGGSYPEYRLPAAIAGGCVVPVGLFIFGWTSYSFIHWVAPIIGTVIFGIG